MDRHVQILGISLFLTLALLANAPVLAQGAGAIWTTTGSCGDETQDTNHFGVGEEVYINGSNFAPGTYSWSIEGKPGGASCDPHVTVAGGDLTVDATGAFCFYAYTVASDDCGEYNVSFGGKNDNYRVEEEAILQISDITIDTDWQETIDWEIDKTADPTEVSLFTGDQAEVGYSVKVDKSSVTSPAVISGSVTLVNAGNVDPEDFSLTITLKKDGGTIDQTVYLVLDPSGVYTFSFTLAAPEAATYVIEVEATLSNGTGTTGSESIGLAKEIIGYPEVHVTDGANTWTFSDDGEANYTVTLSCDADGGKNTNTATITETGQTASADVTVTCYALEVSKTASTTFTRTYRWDIRKIGDKAEDWVSIPLPFDPSAPPLMTPVNYSVVVSTSGYTDSDWQAGGEITISNPAPIPALIQSVSDLISGAGAASVTFAVTFPYTLAPGGTLTGTWSAVLPDAANRINTATAALINHVYPLNGSVSETGTTDFSGTAEIIFALPTTLIDECVTVSDNLAGELGTVCTADAPKTFTYSQSYGPWTPDHCGESYERINVATLIAGDTQTEKSSQWQVVIHVSCEEPQREPLGVKADCIDPYVYKPTIRVHFIVTNPNPDPVEILHGINNALDPVAYQGMQPTLFGPGVTEWEIEIGRYEVLQWLLDGTVATASMRTNICTYATQDDVYIAGVGVFYDTNRNGQYDAGEALLAPDFEGKIGEVYLLDQDGNKVDSRVLGPELFFRAGRDVNFTLRQIWGEYYLVPQLSVPMPTGFRIYPNYRVVHTPEFPEPFYGMFNDFGLVPDTFVPDPLANLDLPYIAALDWYLANPVRPNVAKAAAEEFSFAAAPGAFALEQNYPNPFNPQTTIRYDLPVQGFVALTVYNVSGRVVATLVDGPQEAGSYSLVWNAAGHPSGLYFYELRTDGFRQIKRMMLLK
jgi:hypothetical protein